MGRPLTPPAVRYRHHTICPYHHVRELLARFRFGARAPKLRQIFFFCCLVHLNLTLTTTPPSALGCVWLPHHSSECVLSTICST